jgi:hypothetical protein
MVAATVTVRSKSSFVERIIKTTNFFWLFYWNSKKNKKMMMMMWFLTFALAVTAVVLSAVALNSNVQEVSSLKILQATTTVEHKELLELTKHEMYNEVRQIINNSSLNQFDVCIVVHPKDFRILSQVIYRLKLYAVGLRHVFLVTTEQGVLLLTPEFWTSSEYEVDTKIVTVLNEATVQPCSVQAIREAEFGTQSTWYYQQLLKLNVDTIQGLLERVLIWDADTLLCRPMSFWDETGRGLFHLRTEAEPYYLEFVERVLPDLVPVYRDHGSAVVHHIPIRLSYLRELKAIVSKAHGLPFWQVFLNSVAEDRKLRSGGSEYELYYQFVRKYHGEWLLHRLLEHLNTDDPVYIKATRSETAQYDLISVHYYIRE